MSHSTESRTGTVIRVWEIQCSTMYQRHVGLAFSWRTERSGIVAVRADDRCAGRTPSHCAAARAAPTLNLTRRARPGGAVNKLRAGPCPCPPHLNLADLTWHANCELSKLELTPNSQDYYGFIPGFMRLLIFCTKPPKLSFWRWTGVGKQCLTNI